jgi:transcriptional regulator with XRE-family HTH domain
MTNESQSTRRDNVIHPRIARTLEKIGADISNARRARGISADEFAHRLNVGRKTIYRLESGDPGISFHTFALALHAIGRLDALANIADPENDHVTMLQMKDLVPKRIDRRRSTSSVECDTEDADEAFKPADSANKYLGF